MFVDAVIRKNDRCQTAVTCLRPAYFFNFHWSLRCIFFYHISPVGCTFSCQRKMQDVQKPSIASEFFWDRWNLTRRNGGFSTLVSLIKFEYFLKLEIYNAYDQYLEMSFLKNNSYNWIIFYSLYYFLYKFSILHSFRI